jgi:glycosyltransferase involved in cell wall biosynthesis
MHVLWRYNAEACETQTCFTCQLVSGRPPQWWRYTSLLSRAASEVDRFLCPSRFTLAKHRELGFDGPMIHLPYFLPRSEDAPTAASPHARPYVLFVGRLEKIKGLQNTIRAFRTYRDCDLIVIGDGAYEAELRRAAEGLDHVRFLGRMAYEQLRVWYRHAVAVVMPSICFEVFGIVLLEGFAVRTPALVTPFGALPEVIEDSGGGFVYHDDTELIDGIERLRRDPALRDELGQRGYDAYVARWSEEPHMAQYLDIVKNVEAEGPRKGGRRKTPCASASKPARG